LNLKKAVAVLAIAALLVASAFVISHYSGSSGEIGAARYLNDRLVEANTRFGLDIFREI